MIRKLAPIASLLVVLGSAVGCVPTNWQARCEALNRENDDLQRKQAQTETDFLACKARCESLERAAARVPAAPKAGVTSIPFEVPGDLKGKLDIRRRGDDTVIEIPSDVFFSSGSSTLNREGDKAMVSVVEYIRKNHPEGTLRVEGHSDNDPIKHTRSRYHCNWELSFERAHAVMHQLIEKGKIEPHRVVCESYGEYHPQDPRNKSKNRRVEIVIGSATAAR